MSKSVGKGRLRKKDSRRRTRKVSRSFLRSEEIWLQNGAPSRNPVKLFSAATTPHRECENPERERFHAPSSSGSREQWPRAWQTLFCGGGSANFSFPAPSGLDFAGMAEHYYLVCNSLVKELHQNLVLERFCKEAKSSRIECGLAH